MTTVLMIILFPIGIIFFIYERRNRKENKQIFDDYTLEVMSHESYTLKEKVHKITHMYENNHYKVLTQTDTHAVVAKKHYSIGLTFMGYGSLNLIGLSFYLIYFFFIQKEEIIEIGESNV